MASLRDMGYSVEAAIADLVDNSIDAGASHVHIDAHFAGEDSSITITDDGCGMTHSRLEEAMRYGSRAEYSDQALGRYGLGLKTASLSQCRRLTVATRAAPTRARIQIRSWDLDHVLANDAWQLLVIPPRRCPSNLIDPLHEGPGTVVHWERLDRVLGYRSPGSGIAGRAFSAMVETIRRHLGMVFHRFLTGEAYRRLPLQITVNQQTVQAWDPFARSEPATRSLAIQQLPLLDDQTDAVIRVQPYILPTQPRFSSPPAHAAAGGPRRWNRQQGFYIYLRDRLIQSGGWSRLRAEDEHTKLARVAIDIPAGCEELFGINVSKMRVSLPEPVKPLLRALASGVAARARDAYDIASGIDDQSLDEIPADLDADYLLVTDDTLTVEQVATVLISELEDQPDLLRRVLGRLGLDILDEQPVGTEVVTTRPA
jgi:hypothetical protein